MIKAVRELIESYLFDPSLLDLVLWFPDLSWGEFAGSLLAVLAWRWISDRLERAAMNRLRPLAATVLARVGAIVQARVPAVVWASLSARRRAW